MMKIVLFFLHSTSVLLHTSLFQIVSCVASLPHPSRIAIISGSSVGRRREPGVKPLSLLEAKGFLNSLSSLKGTDFRGTYGNVISGVVDAISPGSCTADLLNQGYSNDLEDDYPFQPACYAGGQENSISCFPDSAMILTENGNVEIKELTTGMKVATLSHHAVQFGELKDEGIDLQTVKLQYEPVAFFLHRNPSVVESTWIILDLQSNQLVLSSDHLVHVCRTPSAGQGKISCKLTAAKRVQQNDLLRVFEGDAKQRYEKVEAVTFHRNFASLNTTNDSVFRGAYAPVTTEGYLIVDGVLVSQYSTLPFLHHKFDSIVADAAHTIVSPLAAVVSRIPSLITPTEALIGALGYMGEAMNLKRDSYIGKNVCDLHDSCGC